MTEVAILGAGLAGLTAARALRERGVDVLLLDKGERPGGRCATRTLAGAVLDTGAQFFTVRSPEFAGLVQTWRDEGVGIREWSRGWARADEVSDDPSDAVDGGDGHPRFSVEGGMNRLAAHLARHLGVRNGVAVDAVHGEAGAWELRTGREALTAPAAIVTAPVPQSLALLDAGGITLDPVLDARLRAHSYERCITLEVALDRPAHLPAPGGVQFGGGPVAWLADAVVKGASRMPGVTVHASPEWSEDHAAETDAAISRDLLHLVRPWLVPAAAIATEVVRWRYSKPHHPTDVGAVTAVTGRGPLVLAGDAFAGGKVEGAVTSGLRAAALVRG